MTPLTPCLWFDRQAEEAATFYVSLFPNSQVTAVSRYGPNQPLPEGTVLTVAFDLDGRPFTALNGGPAHRLTEAFSIQVMCDDQAEVDRLWQVLSSDGGAESMCGWVTDRFGLSWQVIPKRFTELMSTGDDEVTQRVVAAMLTMRKLDVAGLEAAAGLPA